MNKIISSNLLALKETSKIFQVEKLYAFGSVCTPKFNSKSDVDFLVSFKQMDYSDYADAYFELAESLEHILNRPVDLVTEKSLSNPYFISKMNETKTLIYEYGN
jgi:uncharacterized protein